MDFCDQQMLARLFPKLKKEWPDLPVSMNSCYALIPSQSVIFYGTIGDSACFGKRICVICVITPIVPFDTQQEKIMNIKEYMKHHIVIMDGAMGTYFDSLNTGSEAVAEDCKHAI